MQLYWIQDGDGNHAAVDGADQRDRWHLAGWQDASEPAGTVRLWAWHDGVDQPAKFPARIFRERWQPRGWRPGPPPGEPPTAPAAAPSSPAAPAAGSSKPTSKPAAAGGQTKE